MKRLGVLAAVVALLVGLLGSGAIAGENEHPPKHPHAMLHNFEVVDDGGTPNDPSDDDVTFNRCIDLANNNKLPVTAHHHSLHTGTAGLGNPAVGITRAGHLVVPLSPFPGVPFEDCADIETAFGS